MSRRDRFLMIFVVGLGLSFGFVALPNVTEAAGLHDACSAVGDCTGTGCEAAGSCTCEAGSDPSGRRVTVCLSLAAGETAEATPPAESITPPDVAAASPSTVDACSGTWLGFLCSGLVTILGMIAEMIGRLILIVLSILIAFAKYNAFSTSQVVTTGWPIVRDVCNMFFIIILLVSAFSTIIDYGGGELHYSKVLPKLLLMAVLINFSKTLIQLAIDFSQVVMLTFVNAFASAAAGNFINALGLTDMMSLATTAPVGTATQANVIISYMLAIFLLSIVLSVVVIMTGFLIFRIVGLWICLILSPLAFFMTAVPGKLAKSAGGISSEYWGRLGSLLTGGPIMAFFLWLTLAVTQAANASGGDVGLAPALQFQPEGAAQTFLSSIGNANHIASFVVGITLMMMGLDQAVKTASSISSTLGGFAQKARGAGLSLGRLGALAPFLAAGYAGRTAARYGGRAIDQRYDVTAGASRLGLKTLGKVGRFVPDAVAQPVRAGLTRGLVMRRKEASEQAGIEAKAAGDVAKFGTDQEQKLLGTTYSMSGSKFRTLGAKAGSMKVAEILSTDKIRDREIRKNEDKYVGQLKASGMSEAEAKNGSKVLSEKDAYREQQGFIQNQIDLARGLGDLDKVEDLEKAMRINPYMASGEKRKTEIDKLATDPEKFKEINKQDAMSGDLLTGFMMKHGWVADEKTGALRLNDSAADENLELSIQKSGNKTLQEGYQAHRDFVLNSPGITPQQANELQHRKNSADNLVETFNVSRAESGGWVQDGEKMVSGTRVHTPNYAKAVSDLKTSADRRREGLDKEVPQGIAMDFMRNNGTIRDFVDVAKIDDKEDSKLATLSPLQDQLTADIAFSMDAIKSGDSVRANDLMRSSTPILTQMGQSGVTDKMQLQLGSGFIDGLRKADGAIDPSIIRNMDSFQSDIKKAVMNGLDIINRRAEDALRTVKAADRSPAQNAAIEMKFAITKDIKDNGPKGVSQAALKIFSTSARTDTGAST